MFNQKNNQIQEKSLCRHLHVCFLIAFVRWNKASALGWLAGVLTRRFNARACVRGMSFSNHAKGGGLNVSRCSMGKAASFFQAACVGVDAAGNCDVRAWIRHGNVCRVAAGGFEFSCC